MYRFGICARWAVLNDVGMFGESLLGRWKLRCGWRPSNPRLAGERARGIFMLREILGLRSEAGILRRVSESGTFIERDRGRRNMLKMGLIRGGGIELEAT